MGFLDLGNGSHLIPSSLKTVVFSAVHVSKGTTYFSTGVSKILGINCSLKYLKITEEQVAECVSHRETGTADGSIQLLVSAFHHPPEDGLVQTRVGTCHFSLAHQQLYTAQDKGLRHLAQVARACDSAHVASFTPLSSTGPHSAHTPPDY